MRTHQHVVVTVAVIAFLLSPAVVRADVDVNDIAESYVKLVLEIGSYDPGYVDAYFGPPQWRPDEDDNEAAFPAARLRATADGLIERLAAADGDVGGIEQQRLEFLNAQLSAVRARIDILGGKTMSFDEECRALFGAVPPVHEEAHFEQVTAELERLLAGEEALAARFLAYRARFTIRSREFKKALRATIDEYRRRARACLPLPGDEDFELEFVRGKSWTAWLGYQGQGHSLVQVRSDAPYTVAEVTRLVAHELYPGHHTHLVLLEKNTLLARKWMEFCVLPLYCPLALVAEGIAEYACKDLMVGCEEDLAFQQRVLFLLTAADQSEAGRYYRVMSLKDRLDWAPVEAARRYLDGRLNRDGALRWLSQYALVTPGGTASVLRFIEQHRSYVVCYPLGRDMIKKHIESRCGPGSDLPRRWQLFHELLSTPQTPSGLRGLAR